jgi:hypothetical protein
MKLDSRGRDTVPVISVEGVMGVLLYGILTVMLSVLLLVIDSIIRDMIESRVESVMVGRVVSLAVALRRLLPKVVEVWLRDRALCDYLWELPIYLTKHRKAHDCMRTTIEMQ